jgi:outer membrane protein TolC
MAAAAGNAFFDVQVFDARKKSLLTYIKALEKRVAESRALWHGGQILKANFLKVKLAHDNAAQDLLKLQQQRRVATLALGRAIGKPEPIEPSGPAMLATLFPINEDSSGAALPEEDERSDLIALNYQITALDDQAKTLRAAALPRLELQLQWNWSDQEIVSPKSWGEGALALVWNPLAGGQRLTQAQARSAEARALNETLNEARQGIQLEKAQALAAITIAEGEIALGKTGVEQAKEYQRVIRERFLAGRTTTAHLLEAEAALDQQRTRNAIAAIELQRAHLNYHLATGDLPSLTDGYSSQ